MPGNQKGGDRMARKKTIDELRIEREKAERDLKMRQENLKKLKQKEAELILKVLFRRSDNQEMIRSVKRRAEDKSEAY